MHFVHWFVRHDAASDSGVRRDAVCGVTEAGRSSPVRTDELFSLEPERQPATNGAGPGRVLGSAAALDRRHQHEV